MDPTTALNFFGKRTYHGQNVERIPQIAKQNFKKKKGKRGIKANAFEGEMAKSGNLEQKLIHGFSKLGCEVCSKSWAEDNKPPPRRSQKKHNRNFKKDCNRVECDV
jgi:hypothetical protein